MAMNVYLTVFKNYNSAQLRAREPYYHIINYGTPFIIAVIYFFISTESRGKIYGPATLWCWITTPWDFLRVATCYGPAWYVKPHALLIFSSLPPSSHFHSDLPPLASGPVSILSL